MTGTIKVFLSAAAAIFVVWGATACEKIETSKGPAERVGKQLDEAAATAAAKTNEALEKAEKGLEKAGERLQDAARDAQTKIEEAKKEKQ